MARTGGGPQRFGSLSRSPDVRRTAGVQRGCRGDHDRQADQCRDRHTDIGVESDTLERVRGLLGRLDKRLTLRVDTLVLGFLA